MLESAADKQELFYRFWTLKESVMKLNGEGMGLALNKFCICLEKDKMIRAAVDGEIKPYDLREYALDGYRAALCAEADAGEVFFSFQNLQDVL